MGVNGGESGVGIVLYVNLSNLFSIKNILFSSFNTCFYIE